MRGSTRPRRLPPTRAGTECARHAHAVRDSDGAGLHGRRLRDLRIYERVRVMHSAFWNMRTITRLNPTFELIERTADNYLQIDEVKLYCGQSRNSSFFGIIDCQFDHSFNHVRVIRLAPIDLRQVTGEGKTENLPTAFKANLSRFHVIHYFYKHPATHYDVSRSLIHKTNVILSYSVGVCDRTTFAFAKAPENQICFFFLITVCSEIFDKGGNVIFPTSHNFGGFNQPCSQFLELVSALVQAFKGTRCKLLTRNARLFGRATHRNVSGAECDKNTEQCLIPKKPEFGTGTHAFRNYLKFLSRAIASRVHPRKPAESGSSNHYHHEQSHPDLGVGFVHPAYCSHLSGVSYR